MAVQIEAFFHGQSSTMTYVVFDEKTKDAAVIDSALDFDLNSGEMGVDFAEGVIEFVQESALNIKWILETHTHADHITAATYIKNRIGGEIGVSQHIEQVHNNYANILNQAKIDVENCFDLYFKDGDSLPLGESSIKVIEVPGHTPDSVAFLIDGNIFVGDTLFMPDSGTARCDFPGGSAQALFDSIQKLHAYNDQYAIWVCHDYQPNKRELKYTTSVKDSRESNSHCSNHVSEGEFVTWREGRDQGLAVPKLLYPSLQLNMCAGDYHQSQFIYIPIQKSQELMTDE